MRRLHHDTLDSTNAEARRLVARGVALPVLVTANRQTAGRGRQGRTWQSPRGGAWMSCVWPTVHPAEHYAALPLVAALALWRTVRARLDDAASIDTPPLRIKWPNDLLVGGGKVAGVLCEREADGACVVIGVGINVNFSAAELPANVRYPAVTLRDVLGAAVELDALIADFADDLAHLLRGFERDGFTAAMRRDVLERLAFRDEAVELAAADGRVIAGRITGIDASGRVLLATPAGEKGFAVGDVSRYHRSTEQELNHP
ncbi:MAG: biotin--[acetyl-CoA-carboxylase] ligase [Phycisphaeraceae bacterium]